MDEFCQSLCRNVSGFSQVLLPEYGGVKVDADSATEEEYFLFRDEDILGKFER